MRCRGCYAPTSRYCEQGLQLRLEADAMFIASLPGRHERQRWLESSRRQLDAEQFERLEAMARAKYQELRNGQVQNAQGA